MALEDRKLTESSCMQSTSGLPKTLIKERESLAVVPLLD